MANKRDTEGTEVKEVYITENDPIATCVIHDVDEDTEDAQRWWEAFGFVFLER